ncbi:uncharacterized protein BO80DRAFT_318980, partial [Aspergillus ibericus CBS 121593]
KKNNNLYLYIDYRNLNKVSIKNCYSLFPILKILNKVLNNKYFLKINIKNTYYQIYI